MSSRALGFIAALALVWHLFGVLAPAWVSTQKALNGRDFASYYYAVDAARAGEDPYDKRTLHLRARADGRKGAVHPFFYPPPFVVGAAWVAAFDLHPAFLVWFWLDEAAALIAMLVLWRWWRPLHPATPAMIAVLLALTTAVPNNHSMGQANFFVLALVLGGLWAAERDRPLVGGALVGLACMAKMAPALFVMWWILRGRWRPVVAACVTAVLVSVVALWWVGPTYQWRFYTEVLPKFASGDYNGLTIPIQLFGNHSIPNVVDRAFPSGSNALSGTSRVIGSVVTLGLLGALGGLFWRRDTHPWAIAGQASAVAILMLLIPVYTYEHHLVWAIPAAVLTGLAAISGRLPMPLVVVGAASVALLAFDLQALKGLSNSLRAWEVLAGLVQELKMLSLVGLLVTTVWIGRAR